MPYIVSVYVGVAEAAARIARARARKRIDDPVVPYLLGELENSLATAQISVDSMTALANNYEFEPSVQGANAILIRKTIAAEACLETVEKCMEVTGGAGYFRELGLERLLRDVHAAQFHPLPPKRQQLFTGRLAMGLDPVES
jgi:acyl-CoA dehydrogenase